MGTTTLVLAGRYRLESRIAAGGAGDVWRGSDIVLRRAVAVKLLRAEYAQHPETLARFRAEARHAAAVSHPGIAQVYDYGEDGQPFLVMELVDGPSLAEVLARGPLDARTTLDIVAQAATALSAAHAAGLVHRDIKPANLLLGPGGQVKITDFGIAHAAGSAPLTRAGTLIGTPAYLAPERVAGRPATPASDLYSLGIVCYECLTGTRPFTGTPVEVALAHQHGQIPPPGAHVPAAVVALVASLTAKDPRARPASAADTARWADELRDAPPPGAVAPRGGRDEPPPATLAGAQPAAPGGTQPAGPAGSQPAGPAGSRPGPPGGAQAGPPGRAQPTQPAGASLPATLAGGPALPTLLGTPAHLAGAAEAGPTAQAPTVVQAATASEAATATQAATVGQAAPQAPPAYLPPPAYQPPPRGSGRRGRSLTLAVFAAAVAAGLAGWLLVGPGGAHPARHQSGQVPGASPTAPRLVSVRQAALAGLPVSAVSQQLRQLGLRVHVVWRYGGHQQPGTVIAVQPTGRLPAGTAVVVTGALRPTGHGGGNGHGDGKHNGNGEGGGGGDN